MQLRRTIERLENPEHELNGIYKVFIEAAKRCDIAHDAFNNARNFASKVGTWQNENPVRVAAHNAFREAMDDAYCEYFIECKNGIIALKDS